ncbi:Rossmann-fold NAD(P)-binding domain-containing protein [Pseudomonas sp. Marseille-QA0892]
MVSNPVLLVGGSGVIGRQTAEYLRARHPALPLLIGGRDVEKAHQAAQAIGNAEAVRIDLTAEDLGLGERVVGAVVVFLMDQRMTSLRYALSRKVPYLSFSSAVQEMSLEVATYLNDREAAPVVLGTEWLVGATTLPILQLAKAFGRLTDIRVGALIDEDDTSGPATYEDLGRLAEVLPVAMARRNGGFYWRTTDEPTPLFRAVDGTQVEAAPFSAYDVPSLAAATNATNIEFNLATAVTSSRRKGEPPSTEIIIELSGIGRNGERRSTRHAIIHPDGQRKVTSTGVSMLTERLLGLDGAPKPAPGLYFPYQLLSPEDYLDRLRHNGGQLIELDT